MNANADACSCRQCSGSTARDTGRWSASEEAWESDDDEAEEAWEAEDDDESEEAWEAEDDESEEAWEAEDDESEEASEAADDDGSNEAWEAEDDDESEEAWEAEDGDESEEAWDAEDDDESEEAWEAEDGEAEEAWEVDDDEAEDDAPRACGCDTASSHDSFDTQVVNRPCRFIRRIRSWRGASSNDKLILAQQDELCRAVTMAARWAELVENAYQDIYNQRKYRHRRKREWEEAHRGAFGYWFGEGRTGRVPLYTVRRRVDKMHRFFEKGLRFVVIKEQSGYRSYNCNTVPSHNRAYTVAPLIYICPDFFGQPIVRQARLLIHELTHRMVQGGAIAGTLLSPFTGFKGLAGFIAFGHPIIGGDRLKSNSDARQARALAQNRPLAARRSPVNFARLYQEIGTGINTRGQEG